MGTVVAALGASLKYPSNSSLTERVAWKNRLEMHLRQEGLSRVILREAPLVPINGEESEGIDQDHRYNRDTVADHRRVFGILLEAIASAPFESRIHRCSSAPEAWQMVISCIIPQTSDERYLLEQQLENVHYE
ncbi:unnamed protein product, partial [Scytosiphon promiscuus]